MAKSNLFQRTLTALILAPVVIGSILLEFPYYNLLILAVGAVLSWEWANMCSKDKSAVYTGIYTLSMSAAVQFQSWFGIFLMTFLSMVTVLVKARKEKHRWLLLLGVPYISAGIGSLMWLMIASSYLTVLWLLFVVWAVDVGGYLFGKTIKGPKLAPKISPNKTWAGLFGGMFLAGVISYAYAYGIGWEAHGTITIIAVVLALFEQIGDLIESAIKRKVGVKDSSDLIPGHGGIFDRIDGLVFTAPILFVFIYFFSL